MRLRNKRRLSSLHILVDFVDDLDRNSVPFGGIDARQKDAELHDLWRYLHRAQLIHRKIFHEAPLSYAPEGSGRNLRWVNRVGTTARFQWMTGVDVSDASGWLPLSVGMAS